MYSKLIIINHDYERKNASSKVKFFTFKLFATINEFREVSSFFSVLLMMISSLQIISLLKFYLEGEIVDEFQNKLKIMSILLNYPIYTRNLSTSLVSLFTMMIYIFSLLLIILLIVCAVSIAKSKISYYFPFTILMYTFLLIEWVLIVPFLQILYKFDSNLSAGETVINSILIVFYILVGYLISYFNLISSVSSRDFLSLNNNTLLLNNYMLKILVFFMSMVVYKNQTFLYLGYLLVSLFLVKVFIDIFKNVMFCNTSFIIIYTMCMCLISERLADSIIIKVMLHYNGVTFKTYYADSILVLIVAYCLLSKIYIRHLNDYAVNKNFKEIKSANDFIKYTYSITKIVLDANASISKKVRNVGFLVKHKLICKEKHCPLDKDELYIPLTSQSSDKKKEFYNDEVKSYHVIKELYSHYYPIYRFQFEFSLSYILFILFCLGNYELGIVEIETTKKYVNMNLSQQFILFLLKEYANDTIIRFSENGANSHNYSESQPNWSIINMLNVLNYDKICNEVKNHIYMYLDKKRQLWKLFESDNLIIEDIYEVGTMVFECKAKLSQLWKQLNEICEDRPDNEITRLYCSFLKKICYDEVESELILEKKHPIVIRSRDELFNNKFKSDTGVVLIEGNRANVVGTVTYINQALLKMLGYNHKGELIGNNINTIIPGDIGKLHDEILINYFEKGRSNVLKKTLSGISMKNKEKYLLPIHLLISLLPSFGNNIEGIALIRKRLKIDETIICNEMGKIECTTQKIAQALNLTPILIEKNNYYIQSFCPELLKCEKDHFPKFFSEEYYSGKKIEFKLDLNIPSNAITNLENAQIKLKYKAMSVSTAHDNITSLLQISQGNINAIVNNNKKHENNNELDQGEHRPLLVRLSKKPIHKTLSFNLPSTDESEKHLMAKISHKAPDSSNLNNLNSLFINTLGNNVNSNPQSSYNSIVSGKNNVDEHAPKSIDYEQIVAAYKDFRAKCKAHRQTFEGNKKDKLVLEKFDQMRVKVDEVFEHVKVTHKHTEFRDKIEITMSHIGFKILNQTVPVRFISIPSDNIFESKKQNDILSANSEEGFYEDERKDLLGVGKTNMSENEKKEQERELETGSVTGRSSALQLENHLKKLKSQDYDKFGTHKVIGLLMTVSMFITSCVIIILTYFLFDYVNRFITFLFVSSNVSIYVQDIAKYSNLKILENTFSKTNYNNYNISSTSLLQARASSLQQIIQDFFNFSKEVFSDTPGLLAQKYNTKINSYYISQMIGNYFYNILSILVDNAFNISTDGLKYNVDNYINIINEQAGLFIKTYDSIYDSATYKYYYIIEIILFTGLVLILIFLLILFFSYKNKKKDQMKILSAYEYIKNDEVYELLNNIDRFEKRNLEYFMNFEEYKKKKVKFNTKSTQFIGKSRRNKNENDKGNGFGKNKLQGQKLATQSEMKEMKNLINRNNMMINYILSVIVIFTFIIIYIVTFYFLLTYYFNFCSVARSTTSSLMISKFLLSYDTNNIDDILSRKRYLIYHEIDTNFRSILNNTETYTLELTTNINNNPELFMSNITDILNGDVCSILSLSSCNSSYNLQYVHKKGLRSIIAYFMISIVDAYEYYIDHYKTVSDIRNIFSNEKFTLVRFLIENIQIIYNEIFYQINYKVTYTTDQGFISLIIVVGVFNILYLVTTMMKLNHFIDNLKKEEMLCNRIIGELPMEIVKKNSDLKNALAGAISVKKKY